MSNEEEEREGSGSGTGEIEREEGEECCGEEDGIRREGEEGD